MSNVQDESGAGDASAPAERPDPNELEEKLEDECTRLEEQLKQLQSQLTKTRKSEVVRDGDPLLAVYGTKEKYLKAEISVRKDTESPIMSDVFTEPVVLSKLKETNFQLEELVKFSKEQLSDLKRENSTNASTLAAQEQIKENLQQQIGRVTEQDGLGARQADILQRLQEKDKKTSAYYRDLMREMAAFTDEHFPVPDPEDVRRFRKKVKPSGPTLSENVVPLKSLIEELMNRSLEAIHDPYIPITNAFWPPFVELLLRTGIAQRHPADENYIKLTPFHL